MKRAFVCALALAASLSFINSAQASEGFDDLAKLAKAGVGEDVLLAYVNSSPVQYALTVDEILYLNDVGVPNSVVAAVIRKGAPNGAAPVAAAPADGGLIQPQPVPVDQVVTKPEVPAVLPPLAPDYEQAVRESVARAQGQQPVAQPSQQTPYGPAADPVIGRPEPVVSAPQPVYQPAQPAYQPQQPEYQPAQPKLGVSEVYELPQQPVREVVREVIVEKPVYVEQPVYVSSTTVVAPPQDRLNVSFFYESLSPYGSWISIDNDYYWQPTVYVTDRSWRPYWDNGSWVYTDYGWTWQSSYSWGWAPFHYGRWTNHPRHGWCWRPDTVWAPAWVHWRSNDVYTGWAPLPPEARYESGIGFSYRGKNVSLDFHFGLGERDYGFVPVRNFCDHDYRRFGSYHRDRHDRRDYRGGDVVNIYNNTTIVNNYYRYDRDRIINNGPGYDSVRRATNKEIKQVRLTDANYRAGEPIRATRLNDDNTMAVYRPTIRRDAPDTPQQVIARREQEQQRAQAERQRMIERQTQANNQRTTARQEPARRNDTGRIEQVNTQREQQAQREAASRTNREAARTETAAREEQRRVQQQAEAAAREAQRRAEQERQDARQTQRQEGNNRAEAAAREEQRRAQAQQEAAAREQARKAEQAQQEARAEQRRQEIAVREQAERAQREAQKQAELAERQQREAARQASQQEQQRRLEQAQREAQRDIQQAQREAQRQAEQQARQQAAREEAVRAQQMQDQRQAARQQEAAQRQAMAQQQELARQQAMNEQRAQEQARQQARQAERQQETTQRQTAREQAREERRNR